MINSTNEVFKLPIEVYYFSCNLDHVLYETRNLEQYQKEDYAFEFADGFEDNEDRFIDFISDSTLCLASNYGDSWSKIKLNNNALLRYINLVIFFINNFDLLKKEIRVKVNASCK